MGDFSDSDWEVSQDLFASQEVEDVHIEELPGVTDSEDPSNFNQHIYSEVYYNAESEDESGSSSSSDEEELLSVDGDGEIDPEDPPMQSMDAALDTPPSQGQPASVQPTQASWNWNEVQSHASQVNDFDGTQGGWKHNFTAATSILEVFRSLFPSEARQLIVDETNRYADSTGNCLTARWERWTSFSDEELMRYVGILLFMGINKKPEIRQYWSRDPMFQQQIVPQMMTQDRFMEVSKYLHFCNNEEQPPSDRLFKIRKLWDINMSNFQGMINPNQNVSIDESLILHKGHLYFKQFIPSKRSRFGIKTFSIVDDLTKFVLNSIIYAGKNHEMAYSIRDYGYGGAIVLGLMEPRNGNGQRKCLVCAKTIIASRRKKIMTSFRCSTCKVALCPVFCHERYHSVKHF